MAIQHSSPDPGSTATKPSPFTLRSITPTLASLILGLTSLVASYRFSDGLDSWLAGTLQNVSVGFLLFAPLYWMTKTLDVSVKVTREETKESLSRIDSEITRATASAEKSAERITNLETAIDARLEQFREEFGQRQSAARQQSSEILAAIRSAPTRAEFMRFLAMAYDNDWLAEDPSPRVEIGIEGAHLVLNLHFFSGELEWFEFYVTGGTGGSHNPVSWSEEDERFVDFAPKLQRICEPHLGSLDLEGEDPATWIGRFAELATLAASKPGIKPLVAYYPPQWAISTRGLHAVDRNYDIASGRVQETDWESHLRTKTWIDPDSCYSALTAARTLWPKQHRWGDAPF